MAGIESYAVALPGLRLPASAYVEAWGMCGARGMKQKAFCAYDEDAVTLGIDAARAAIDRAGLADQRFEALFFGVTTPPYDEKPSAGTLPTALFDNTDLRVTEITGSPQAGMQALVSAFEFCAAKEGRRALVVAADAPSGPADASYEHALGAAAAAFVIGPDGDVAELVESFAVTRETFGARFRRHGQDVISDLELRTRDALASVQAIGRATKGIGKVKRLALGADAGLMRGVARALGQPDAAIDATWSQIGDVGSASAPFALAAALDEMRVKDTVLAAGVGAGATAGLFRAGKGLSRLRRKGTKVADAITAGRTVDYIGYLKNKRMLSSRTGGQG